jgi:anti-sigma factor RsiW
MSSPLCFWYRSRLAPHADGALEGRSARSVAAHVQACGGCREQVEDMARTRRLLVSALTVPPEPNWSGFWPAVQRRIVTQAAKPIREPWWLPWWKPVWGHPRLATSGLLAGGLALTLALWPSADNALAAPVVVQDVAVTDPRGSVMVYSNKDTTVIWMFAADTSTDD